MSFDFENTTGLDSCDAHLTPCVLMNPLDSDDLNQVFITDPALLNTRTLVAVNVNEHDNFPTSCVRANHFQGSVFSSHVSAPLTPFTERLFFMSANMHSSEQWLSDGFFIIFPHLLQNLPMIHKIT